MLLRNYWGWLTVPHRLLLNGNGPGFGWGFFEPQGLEDKKKKQLLMFWSRFCNVCPIQWSKRDNMFDLVRVNDDMTEMEWDWTRLIKLFALGWYESCNLN